MQLAITPAEALPSLATDCVLVGHERKVDAVWTRPQFLAMCEHMHNDNDPHFFMIPYRRDIDGSACYAKAKNARADKRARWAWDTITGKAKQPASIGFYPRNAEGKSRWAAMDFDAHDGNSERPRKWALDAFKLLCTNKTLFLALCTSGNGGWHLFIFTREFYDVDEWTRLLRQAAAMVGATIQKGLCEIFPTDTRGRVGLGIRAPGTWNPKNGAFGVIAEGETITPLLQEKESSLFISRSTPCLQDSDFTYRQKRQLYRGLYGEWKNQFQIVAISTRRARLVAQTEHIFRQVGGEVALQNAEAQHIESTVAMNATLSEHIAEFSELWAWLIDQSLKELSENERCRFDSLSSDNECDAFRIIRSYSIDPRNVDTGDFAIVAANLAARLSLSLPGAANIRKKFCALGIIEQTAPYVPNKRSARFRWTANIEQPF